MEGLQKSVKIGTEGFGFESTQGFFGDDQYLFALQLMLLLAVGFANNAFDQITFNIVSRRLFCYHYAKAWLIDRVFCRARARIENKKRAHFFVAGFKQAVKVSCFKARCAWKE